MPNKIERLSSTTASLAITADPATSARIPYGAVAGGTVFIESLSTGTKITWYVAAGRDSSAVPLYDYNNISETFVSANRAYPVPDGCFAVPFVIPVLDAGTATASFSVKG